MAQLTQIDTSSFELIRDRIAQVLLDEYTNQYSLDNTLPNITEVFIERFTAFDKSELPAMNVYFMGGPIEKENIKKQVANYKYAVDCYANAKSTDSERADKAARIKVQKILRIVRAVLDDQHYKTLLFPSPFVIRTNVDEIIMNLNKDEDSKNTAIGRVVFTVEAYENSQLDDTTPLELVETQALLFDTEKGYKWVLESGNTPDAPTLSGTAVSATQNDLSWTSVTGADEYKIYKNGIFIDTVSTTNYTDTTSNEVDNYQVTALDGSGLESLKSNLIYLYAKDYPSITVEISGETEPNQFEDTTYTATLTGVNGASTDPADYSFMWIVQKDGSTVIAKGVNGSNTVDLNFELSGDHLISVTVSGDGLSATNTYNIDVSSTINFPGIMLYLIADQGITADGDNNISLWADQSGNNRDFVQSTVNLQPTFFAAHINNNPAVKSDGNDLLTNSFVNWGDEFSVFVLVYNDSINNSYSWFDTTAGTLGGGIRIYNVSDRTRGRIVTSAGAFDVNINISSDFYPETVELGQYRLIEVSRDSSGLLSLRIWHDVDSSVNGLQDSVSTSGTITPVASETVINEADSYMRSCLVYDHEVSSANRDKVLNFFKQKYDLAYVV